MGVKVTNVGEVLDPWLESESREEVCLAVLQAIADAADNYAALWNRPAAFGHPPKRAIEVGEVGVLIRVLLPHPHRGIHLLQISSDWDGERDDEGV